MIEDAGARADGGDTEAPAEAPNEKLKHTRSSRRRLERVLTESSLKTSQRLNARATTRPSVSASGTTASAGITRANAHFSDLR